MRLTPIYRQLYEPQHCYIEIQPGKVFCHNKWDRDNQELGWAGQPVRFSRLAAERYCEVLVAVGCKRARILDTLPAEAKRPSGRK